MPVPADLGSFTPSATVTVAVATLNDFGGLEPWGGLALLVRPGGQASEDGVTPSLGADGRHKFTINLPLAAELGGPLEPGRYRVALYGDPIPQAEEIQGVVVAVFDVAGA